MCGAVQDSDPAIRLDARCAASDSAWFNCIRRGEVSMLEMTNTEALRQYFLTRLCSIAAARRVYLADLPSQDPRHQLITQALDSTVADCKALGAGSQAQCILALAEGTSPVWL